MEQSVLILIAIRPALDLFTDRAIWLGPLKINLAALVSLVLLMAGCLWFFALEKQERIRILKFPLVWILAGWVLSLAPWSIVPVIFHGSSRLVGLREWVRLLSLVPIVLILTHLAEGGNTARVLRYLFLSFLLPALIGFYQIFFHEGAIIKDVHRITGTFVHPNPLSFYLVLMIGITYWKVRWEPKRLGWSALLVLEIVLLLATFSFTGAAMFALLALVCALGENRTVRIAAVSLLVVFLLGFLTTHTGWKRLIDESKMESLDEVERSGKETTSLIWRVLNWRFLYRTWLKSPYLGYGLASTPQINPMKTHDGAGADPHNDYMRYLVETGLLESCFSWFFLLGLGKRFGERTGFLSRRKRSISLMSFLQFIPAGCWVV